MSNNIAKNLAPYSPSLRDFCRFLEKRGKLSSSPKSIVELWESQAEALRIGRDDASVEAIDMLLNTMLTTLHHLAEAEEQQRWPNRMKALFHSRSEQVVFRTSKTEEERR